MKIRAFTLAEVLITLGIIGIVAAMTLPNIIAGYNKKVVETRLAKLYSTINQAIRMSEVKNGVCRYWDWGDINNHRDIEIMEQWWNTYLKDFIPDVIATKKDYGNDAYKLYFKDGSALTIEAIPGTYIIFILYPQAKFSKSNTLELSTEKAGKDSFKFLIYPTNDTGCNITTSVTIRAMNNEELKTKCLEEYKKERYGSGGYCAELIIRNGWKIPDDYPIRL